MILILWYLKSNKLQENWWLNFKSPAMVRLGIQLFSYSSVFLSLNKKQKHYFSTVPNEPNLNCKGSPWDIMQTEGGAGAEGLSMPTLVVSTSEQVHCNSFHLYFCLKQGEKQVCDIILLKWVDLLRLAILFFYEIFLHLR